MSKTAILLLDYIPVLVDVKICSEMEGCGMSWMEVSTFPSCGLFRVLSEMRLMRARVEASSTSYSSTLCRLLALTFRACCFRLSSKP